MVQKVKPRWGFKNIVDAARVSKEEVESIVEEIGIELQDDHITELSRITSKYLSDKEVLENFPRHSEVGAALKEINDQTQDAERVLIRLQQSLKELDFISKGELLKNEQESNWLDNFRDRILNRMIDEIRLLNVAANKASEGIPKDTGGHPKNLARKLFIQNVAEVFEKATGKRATVYSFTEIYTGPFYDLVEAFVKAFVPEDFHSNSSLGQHIKAVLKARKP